MKYQSGRIVVLAALTLATGCSFIPAHQRPAAPVPETFPHAGTTAATPLDAIAWCDYFADARLREAIALALENNRDLRVAALNIERARARHRIRHADLFPRVGATASQNAQHLPADLASGEADTDRQYSATIGFSAYELDFFGRIRSLDAQALELYLATGEARRSAQISLVAEVAGAWLTLAAERERLTLAQRTLETRRQSHELIRRSREVGAGSALDLRQAETLLEVARAEVAASSARAAQAGHALTLLAGTPVPAELLPQELTGHVSAVTEVPAGLPSEVLARRPDILQAEHALRAANANIGAARAAFFPSVTLTAAAGLASGALSGLFAGGAGTWSFTPQVRLPIFEAGRLDANLQVARVEREIGVARYEQAIQGAFREVADALAERATLGERLDAQRRLVEASADSLRLSKARYRAGVDSYLGLLDAQRTLFGAEQGLIDVRLADALNRVTLYKVLGGGWQ